ncbi:MAG TPA: PD-(D/E)XK nuclease family protein, partial [Chitinophagaceae bacterium]|nr:PD-(D/E)XK nuclease family protein [Chitinophagaceae bacterium]
ASNWEKKRKPGGGYKLPDTVFSFASDGDAETALEEMRRLFYVAVTRAEKYLNISYCKFKTDGRELEPSIFITEIKEVHTDIATEPGKVSEENILLFSELQFKEMSPEIEKLEKNFVDALLANFTMNVTALNNYLKCPLEFYFKNLLRIPSPKNEATEFGSAVHYALEQLFRKMQNSNDTFPSKKIFISDFEWYMQRHRESFTEASFTRRMDAGKEILSNYYDQYVHKWNKVVSVERNIKNVVVDGVPIKGKLDKLEFDSKLVNVVDYKTGDPERGIKKMNAPNPKEPNGGDYWRQAVFYKILLDNYTQKDWKVISSEFDFVEPDNKKNYRKEKILISAEDVTTVRQQIQSTWQKIQAHDFYTGCGKEDCHWCNFVKTNHLAIALHEIETEEE